MGLLVTLMVAGLIVGYFSFTAKRVQKKKAGYSRQADKKNPQKAGVDVLKWLFAHGSTLVQLAAYMMLLTAVWLALGDFFPTVWGVANEKVGVKYLIPIILAVVALVILYIASTKKSAATGVTVATKKAGGGGWISRFFEPIFAIGVLIVVTAALAMVFSAVYQAYEGGHEGPVAWTDGSLSATGYEAAKDGIGVIPVSSGQRVAITAQVTFWDQIPHTLKRWRDGFFTNKLGIVTYTEPATVQKTVSVSCAPGATCSFCFTSNLPRPQEGLDWRVVVRDQGGSATYADPPYKQTQWRPFPQPSTTFYFRGDQGVMYVYGGQKSGGACVP